MGPHGAMPGTLMVYDEKNNEYVKFGNIENVSLCEIQESTVESDVSLHLTDSFDFSVELILPKCSRKRFVKKLMSVGIQRNIANRCAKVCVKNKIPYKFRLLYAQLLFGRIL